MDELDFDKKFNEMSKKSEPTPVVADVQTTPAPEVNEPQADIQPKTENVAPTDMVQPPAVEKVEDWKAKYETVEKQRRDLQAHHDKRFNDLEKKFNDLLSKNSGQSQTQEAPKEKEVDDTELNEMFYENPAKAVSLMLAKNLKNQNQPGINQFAVQEEVMRNLKPDYDEVINVFREASSYNPSLIEDVKSSANKAKAAYELGLKLKEAQRIQKDPIAYEKELRAKWEQELEQKTKTGRGLNTIPASSPTTARSPNLRKSDDFEAGWGKKR